MPERITISRAKGWRMPPNIVKVDRTTRWGNPFDFRRSEYCWAAISYGCRGDAAGRQEASVKAFREWIDPAEGGVTVCLELQPKIVNGDAELPLGPFISVGRAPTKDEVKTALRGKNLACWCRPGQPCHADVLLEIANA